MKLKDVFLFLYNSNINELNKNTNINNEIFEIRSNANSLVLSKIPVSKDHILIFKNGELLDDNFSLINSIIQFESNIFKSNDVINVFYFEKINKDYEESNVIEYDEFQGGNKYYILKLGVINRNNIIVVVNDKIYEDFEINDGILKINGTTHIDKIFVYYLNRGLIERISKISLNQLNLNSIDTRYVRKELVYTKEEVDSKLFNLNENSPMSFSDLNSLSRAIDNNPNFYEFIMNHINDKAELYHNHNNFYYKKIDIINILNNLISNSSILSDNKFYELLDNKINLTDTYTKMEVDLIISTLPGKNTTDRGLFIAGGVNRLNSDTNVIDIININTQSNAIYFGNFQVNRRGLTATSNGIKNIGLVFGGDSCTNNSGTTSIFFMNILVNNSISYFGDLSRIRNYATSASNGTNNLAVVLSGNKNTEDIEFILINQYYTSGGLFGKLSAEASKSVTASCSSGKNNRVVFGPVVQSGNVYTNEYINLSSFSDSILFGQCENSINDIAGTSNDMNNRGVFIGGVSNNSFVNKITYINISNISNTSNFGLLMNSRAKTTAISNGVNNRGIISGGNIGPLPAYNYTNNIEYISINSLSNSINFGNLTLARGDNMAGISNSAL